MMISAVDDQSFTIGELRSFIGIIRRRKYKVARNLAHSLYALQLRQVLTYEDSEPQKI